MTVGKRRLTVCKRAVLVGSCGVPLGILELPEVVVQRSLVGVVRRGAVMRGGPHMTINGGMRNGLCHVVRFLSAFKGSRKRHCHRARMPLWGTRAAPQQASESLAALAV